MSVANQVYRKALAMCGPVVVPAGNRRFRSVAGPDARTLLRTEAERAIDRAVTWFRQFDDLEISALFLLQELHLKSVVFDVGFVEDRIRHYLATHDGFRNRMFDPNHPYDPTLDPMGVLPETRAGSEVYEAPLDPIMRRCLYADRLGLGPEFLDELASLDDGGGYGTTHIVVGGRLLKRLGVIDPALIDRLMQSTAGRIAAAQAVSWAGDLFAERIVVLQWLGRHDLVDPAWIVRLLRAQNPDGGWWGSPSMRSRVSNQHTTVLGIGALAMFLDPSLQP